MFVGLGGQIGIAPGRHQTGGRVVGTLLVGVVVALDRLGLGFTFSHQSAQPDGEGEHRGGVFVLPCRKHNTHFLNVGDFPAFSIEAFFARFVWMGRLAIDLYLTRFFK